MSRAPATLRAVPVPLSTEISLLMESTPEAALLDARRYLSAHGVGLTPEAEAVIHSAEHLAFSLNTYVYAWTFMTAVLEHVQRLRAVVAARGIDPTVAHELLARFTADNARRDRTSYDILADSYTAPFHGDRRFSMRARTLDFALASARRRGMPVDGVAMCEATLASHDESFPFLMNGNNDDDRLKTPFNTLSHFVWRFEPNLDVRFSDIREALGIPEPTSSSRPLQDVPPSARAALLSFLVEHPDYERNCFLIMPFVQTPLHKAIGDSLRAALRAYGFNPVRADDRVYSEDLLTNIQAYMHGCRLAVAVFDRIQAEAFNPNVSLEVGYFLGMRRPVCLLKERTLPRLPSDLVGRLYVEFDVQALGGSLTDAVGEWLRARGLTSA